MRQAQKGPVVHLAPGDLAFEAFGDVGQCPQPVGREVLNFQVVGRGGFQLACLHQRLLVAELAGFRVVKGFDGGGQDDISSVRRRWLRWLRWRRSGGAGLS